MLGRAIPGVLLLVCAGAARSQDDPKPDRGSALRELRDFSVEGRHRRLGPDYAHYHKDGPAEEFPKLWMPPVKEGPKGRRWEYGGPWSDKAGDFSSTQGQVLYTPERGFGVDRVTILEMSNGCFSERPEPPWWGGFRPEPTSKLWADGGAPIAMARGMGTWSNCGVIVFSSGLVGTAGTCTGKGSDPTLRLPRNKLPTAVSVTNKNEFALITVVDTDKMKGQVAVIALESSGKKTGFAHEWREDHPCLPNVAVFTSMKLLGFVDLPGMTFPTAISAAGDSGNGRFNGPDGNAGMLSQCDLTQQTWRDSFYKGGNSGYASRAGLAVVASKYDEKVAFLDLAPLFERVRELYFTTDENYKKTRDQGPGPKQFPQTFEIVPEWQPKVLAVVAHPAPTAVLAPIGGKKGRAFVASQDGKVSSYSVAGTDAKVEGAVQVGRNPICLAYAKHSGDTFLAVSRGDREIAWVKDAQVVRRLRDARLLDPVGVEVADTHGIETALITVCDFKGRKIVNYRTSPLVFATNGGARFGMGLAGKDEAECGGFMDLPGAPFCVSASNVN